MQVKRLDPSLFKIPTDKLRCGYYSDRYFLRTRDVLRRDRHEARVGYQFFPREHCVICGLDEAIAILKTCAGRYSDERKANNLYQNLRHAQWELQRAAFYEKNSQILNWQKRRARIRQQLNRLWIPGWKNLQVWAHYDGARIKKNDPVLAIRGNPELFVHLETALLGTIARPTATATAVNRVVKAACGKQVFFFSARFDHYWVQATDGYAALKAGAFAVSTDANADYWGMEGMGTMPHFIIGCYGGSTVRAFDSFDRHVSADINRIALVDWENDCVGTTRKIIEHLILKQSGASKITGELFSSYAPKVVGVGKNRLWGVRFDTSGSLRDRSVEKLPGKGVTPELVRRARKIFDRWQCQNLKIVVSGGFDEQKIRHFEKLKIPVDAYGVGSSLLRHQVDITADIVEYNGKPCAKVGRSKKDWSKLSKVQ